MQNQAPGYSAPKKRVKGVKKGSSQVRTGQSPKGRTKAKVNKQVRKTSWYSKNRAGVKTTKTPGMKSTALGPSIQRQQPMTNNQAGAFEFPGAAPLL